mgnify:CR=1 FL=1
METDTAVKKDAPKPAPAISFPNTLGAVAKGTSPNSAGSPMPSKADTVALGPIARISFFLAFIEIARRKTVPAVFDFMITPFLVLFIMLILSLLKTSVC